MFDLNKNVFQIKESWGMIEDLVGVCTNKDNRNLLEGIIH